MKRGLKYVAIIAGAVVAVLLLAVLIASRCTTQVLVVDEAGALLGGAEVTPQSLSINYASKTTDADGAMRLPLVPQAIHWISVTKKGYQDYRSGDIEHMKRVIVVLKKVPNQTASGNGAITPLFHIGRSCRAVPEQRCWAAS
jgi:hypothetical protein